jgi:lipopolysaccharide/colanic/teichoic acid biosynthesis glycosyltransferase
VVRPWSTEAAAAGPTPPPLPGSAELFLLTDSRTLAFFRLRPLLDALYWSRPEMLWVRIGHTPARGTPDESPRPDHYQEHVESDVSGRFVRVRRAYGPDGPRVGRVALTASVHLAKLWRNGSARSASGIWSPFRRQIQGLRREAAAVKGRVYDRDDPHDVARCVRDLVRIWRDPSATIPGIRRVRAGVWSARTNRGPGESDPAGRLAEAEFVAEAWIGAGRQVGAGDCVLGPAVLWDEPSARSAPSPIRWREIEPTDPVAVATAGSPKVTPPTGSMVGRFAKRSFDIAFSIAALAATLPLYPLVMLAIWLEDGRPFFFAHRRQTMGGREFPCIKFRSMRKDAEKLKAQLQAQNRADGPQFFIENDPRLTRVGRLIRALNIDELPQFINVLLGHMSVVGPRPSPRQENQCCPEWHDVRLSVRAGITGLWQVSRTRQAGADFQEWIRYDLDYVQRRGFWLDMVIIVRTFRLIVGW